MKPIAIGVLALALMHGEAAAQTTAEKAQILRDFQASVAAVNTTTPAPKIFTLPVAMVFRQVIAKAAMEHGGVTAISVLQDALPPLPTPLEYQLVGHDLVIRNKEADVVVGVLHEAVGPALAMIR